MADVRQVQGIRCRSREDASLPLSAGWAVCGCLLRSSVPAAAVHRQCSLRSRQLRGHTFQVTEALRWL